MKSVNKIVKKLYKINDKLRGTSITKKQCKKLQNALLDLEYTIEIITLNKIE